MKLVRSLLLGTAAGVVALTGAQAADLPMAEPVQYVRICDTFGAGFFYIPGTQTCLRIAGRVTAQYRPFQEQWTRTSDVGYFRTSAIFNFDARSQTEWGTLRSYIQLRGYWESNTGQRGNYLNLYGRGTTDRSINEPFINAAFVQFAGITAGYASSFFDANGAAGFITGPQGSAVNTMLAGYTATFGSGWSATLSAEDARYRRAYSAPSSVVGGGFGLSPSPINYAAAVMPDIVGNIRIDQSWGFFQLAGAVHQLRNNATGTPAFSTAPLVGGATGTFASNTLNDTDYGWAVQGSVKIMLPMIAKGDFIFGNAAYAEGAMGYLAFTGAGRTPLAGTTAARTTAGLPGIGYSDAYVDPVTHRLRLSSGYHFVLGATHYWTPSLRSTVVGNTGRVSQFGGPGLLGASYSYDYFNIEGDLVWSPIRDLDLGLGVLYQSNYNMDLPALWRESDANRWTTAVWVERRF